MNDTLWSSRIGRALGAALVVAAAGTAGGQSPAPRAAEEIVERERIRAGVAAALDEYYESARAGATRVDKANELLDRFAAEARDVAPYLVEELERDLQASFDVCALALARVDVPEVEPALRRAIARADEELGDRARMRKALAAWALGIHGQVEALDLIEQGRHLVGNVSVHDGMSLIEAIAFHTAPQSAPRVVQLVERYADDPERKAWAIYALGALRRAAEPSTVPALIGWLEHPDGVVRREAARALGTVTSEAAEDALVAALSSPGLAVRRTAADALDKRAPARSLRAVLARLDVEEDVLTRTSLYHYVARARGAKGIDVLMKYWGREDARDRQGIVQALATIGEPGVVDALKTALGDESTAVVLPAADALARIGTPAASAALLDALSTASSMVKTNLTRLLGELHAPAAGEPIAAWLFSVLPSAEQPIVRLEAERLIEALVAVRHTASAAHLREASKHTRDRSLQLALESGARRLEALDAFAGTEEWIAAAADEDRAMRQTAYQRLGDIGDAAAIEALAAAFDTAQAADRVDILRAIGRAGSPHASPLLERVLTSDEFDALDQRTVRQAAAWAARRIGGDEMFTLLRAAVERRHGRDPAITVYAALTGGRQALPLLAAQRRSQLSYFGWERGKVQERLDRLAHEIAAGISLWEIDRPPEQLSFVP